MADETPTEGGKKPGKVADLAAEAFKRGKRTKRPPSGPPPVDDAMKLIRRRGEILSCMANVYQVLVHRPEWNGVLGFDEFSQCVVKRKVPPYAGGALGEWDSSDDSRSAVWIAQQMDFTPSSTTVLEAVELHARDRPFHPVREWLRALPAWDGTARLDNWLVDHLGAKQATAGSVQYVGLVSRFFLIGMIKRVMEPGCKFDYCLVLEGTQGKKKSTALSILADPWFGDTDLDLHNKDSMLGLRGKWLYEFAELGALARAESLRQKSFLSRRADDFRPPFGRRVIRALRQVCFSGTTNEWEWNKDPTGGRRFWPIEVSLEEIDTVAFAAVREQLFAEALLAYDRGERCWPTSAEQRTLFDPEQLRREQQDGLIDALHDWVFDQTKEFSLADACMTGLKLDASKLTRDMQTRIGIALHKLGCRKIDKKNGMTRFWYEPPPKPGVTPGARLSEEKDVPF